ncbi:MAG: type II toxin-antitoxin system VapB family antitoxin [Rhodomicrobium sp.]
MSTTIELSGHSEVLASKVATKKGVTIEQAVAEAIADSARNAGLLDESEVPPPEKIVQALDDLSRRFVAFPLLDTRPPDEIIGYDEFGLPR